jgi:hypothetical protein
MIGFLMSSTRTPQTTPLIKAREGLIFGQVGDRVSIIFSSLADLHRLIAEQFRPALARFYESLDQGQKLRFAGMSAPAFRAARSGCATMHPAAPSPDHSGP